MTTAATAHVTSHQLDTSFTLSTPGPPTSLASVRSPMSSRTANQPWSSNSPSSASPAIITSAAGAEGGAGAIGVRRRESNSFKTMTTGSLVSNSPFTQRLNNSSNPTARMNPAQHSPVSSSRIPTSTRYASIGMNSGRAASPVNGRKTSGGNSRKSSREFETGPVKENAIPRDDSGEFITGNNIKISSSNNNSDEVKFRPNSVATPFRPMRNQTSENSSLTGTPFNPSTNNSAFKPTRSNQISSTNTMNYATDSSPPLVQAPYEIAPLNLESAPFGYEEPRSPNLSHKASASGLGRGPVSTGMPGRQFAGASAPPPNTPPHQRNASISSLPSPNSALNQNSRRGMTGPRLPLLDSAKDSADDRFDLSGDVTETERDANAVKTLKRKPSNKTVTWAATEEVLEFEVDDRRASGVSDASYWSSDAGAGGQLRDFSEEGNSSYGFEEGGSVEVHDVETSEEEEEEDDDVTSNESDQGEERASVVSTASVDDIIEDINEYLHHEDSSLDPIDVFSPSQIERFDTEPTAEHAAGSRSALSTSSASHGSDAAEPVDSDYDSDAEERRKVAASQALARTISQDLTQTRPQETFTSAPKSPQPGPSAMTGLGVGAAPFEADSLGAHNLSKFSLPDIPGTSPFLGFDDESATNSVVTLDMNRATLPLRNVHNNLLPTSSTPQKADNLPKPASTPPSNSINLGSLPLVLKPSTTQETSLQLSRQASLVGSEVPSSVSYYGSIGSNSQGPIFMSRGRLDGTLTKHQNLFDYLGDTPSSTTDRLPQNIPLPASPTKSSAPSREILVRPAPKARSATLSSGMLPTIQASPARSTLEVGSLLTADVAKSMESPLDRFQRGVNSAEQNEEWRAGDSLLNVAAHAETSNRPTPRRRSLSTGDAQLSETGSVTSRARAGTAIPEFGFELNENLNNLAEDRGFAADVGNSLNDIYNSRDRSYKLRERPTTIYASAEPSRQPNKAGEVDLGRAWRKKRPSNVHEISKSMSVISVASTADSRKSRQFAGQLFVHLREAIIDNCAAPHERTAVLFSLDNGRQRVEAGERNFDFRIPIKKEFELVCSEQLQFNIDLHINPKQLEQVNTRPVVPVVPAPAPASPTKTSRFRNVFSSPKKKIQPAVKPAPPPSLPEIDPFYSFVAKDGKLCSATVRFAEEMTKARLTKSRICVPFGANPGAVKSCQGHVIIDLLFLPYTSGVIKASLPKSMDEALQGLECAKRSEILTFSGVLTQLGGDCQNGPRRRFFRLRGQELRPYSEVTKKSFISIDLSLAVNVVDLSAPVPNSPKTCQTLNFAEDDEEIFSKRENSFRLIFKDGKIDFIADSEKDKTEWIEILQRVISGINQPESAGIAPVWAVTMNRKAEADRVAAAAKA